MLMYAVKPFTPAWTWYQALAKAGVASWIGGWFALEGCIHPITITGSRRGCAGTATKMPVCLCRLPEAFYPFAMQTLPKKNPFITSFVGSAELEIRAAFSRCWCENAEFTRCQSGSKGMLGVSLIYTNLHKNEGSLVSQKRQCQSPRFLFVLLKQNISPHSSLRLFKWFPVMWDFCSGFNKGHSLMTSLPFLWYILLAGEPFIDLFIFFSEQQKEEWWILLLPPSPCIQPW